MLSLQGGFVVVCSSNADILSRSPIFVLAVTIFLLISPSLMRVLPCFMLVRPYLLDSALFSLFI
jgi:hypothetical protein